jgi:outer membrane protein TolC
LQAQGEISHGHSTEHADSARGELRGLVWQLGSAAMQVSAAGTEAQVERAKAVLKDARRALYRLLAEDEGEEAPPAPQD